MGIIAYSQRPVRSTVGELGGVQAGQARLDPGADQLPARSSRIAEIAITHGVCLILPIGDLAPSFAPSQSKSAGCNTFDVIIHEYGAAWPNDAMETTP
jgi:hypothetical protein